MQHATLAASAMLLTDSFFPTVTVTDDQRDRDLAAWQIGRTVRMITSFDCSDASCIDDPAELWQDIYELLPDLDPALIPQARTLMLIAKTVERDRLICSAFGDSGRSQINGS